MFTFQINTGLNRYENTLQKNWEVAPTHFTFNFIWEKDAPLPPCEMNTRLSDSNLHENYLKCCITKGEFESLQEMLLMQNKCPTIQKLKTNLQIIAQRKQTP